MVVRIRGGYNTATGWPPDESTGVEFQNDVEIPGQFKGGGAGFGWGDTELPGEYGPGGFYKPGGVPSIVGPATGQQGTSLSSVPRGGAATTPGDIIPPQNRTIPLNKSVGPFTGGSATENIIRSGLRRAPGVIGAGVRRIPGIGQIIDAVTPTEELAPRSMDEAPPWSWPGAGNPGMPGATVRGPIPMNPDAMPDAAGAAPTPNFVRPEGEVPRTYPMWPTPPAPVTAGPASYPHMPWPDTGVAPGIGSRAPATPPPRPGSRAAPAGPAAQRQKPNLGNYKPFVQVARPNADVAGGARGRQSVPYTTALDLSHLFGGGR
jgi:hypothetical protein